MGSATLRQLSRKLIEHGLPADTPAAAVSHGTTPRQHHVFAHLHDIADQVVSADLSPPMLTIIGKVVDIAALLAPARFHAVRGDDDDPIEVVAGA